MRILDICLILIVAVVMKPNNAKPLETGEVKTTDASHLTVEQLKESKRFKLLEFAYENLWKTLWNEEVFTTINDFLQNLKEWTKDETLQQSAINGEFEVALEKCIGQLKDLRTDPGNCQKQESLKYNIDKMGSIFESANDTFPSNIWGFEHLAFSYSLDEVTRNSYDQYFKKIEKKVKEFIAELNEAEKHKHADIEECTITSIYVHMNNNDNKVTVDIVKVNDNDDVDDADDDDDENDVDDDNGDINGNVDGDDNNKYVVVVDDDTDGHKQCRQ
ncbi:MATH and LRR domain-containing protein PFE0570w-like [Musca vetustissima]|uniref:MATH and LRR domain-containing protein PFE0570w-like n=1 Tax=Musca vetustissima TaxID=27455 RepID=UPI002AB7F224|nr:MATH and LRR domain-containing protein PFE0570w-like [Musca vetustissima]